jgi:hypothetical protein
VGARNFVPPRLSCETRDYSGYFFSKSFPLPATFEVAP